MVQAYYPAGANAADFPRAAWIADPAVQSAFATSANLPAFALSHVGSIMTNARLDAPPTPGMFPVIVISHGWSGSRVMHADLAEELASRGALVLLIDHPYGALAVTLPPCPKGERTRHSWTRLAY